MIPPGVRLHRPVSVEGVLERLQEEDAALLAGGTELLLLLRLGLTQVDHLVSLRRVPGLAALSRTPEGDLSMGAGVTHQQVADSLVVQEVSPVLARSEGRLANLRVRVSGTLAGSLAFADPHSDTLTMLSALGARLECVSLTGRRVVPVEGFVAGPFTTLLEPGELITRIVVPAGWLGARLAHQRFESRRQRPMVTVSCAAVTEGERLTSLRLVVGSVCPAPVLVEEAVAALIGVRRDDVDDAVLAHVAEDALAAVPVRDDEDGSSDYKRHLVAALVERALSSAVNRA